MVGSLSGVYPDVHCVPMLVYVTSLAVRADKSGVYFVSFFVYGELMFSSAHFEANFTTPLQRSVRFQRWLQVIRVRRFWSVLPQRLSSGLHILLCKGRQSDCTVCYKGGKGMGDHAAHGRAVRSRNDGLLRKNSPLIS